ECLGARPRVADEQRPRHAGERQRQGHRVVVAMKDERNRTEHRRFADTIGGGVQERAKRRRLASRSSECPIEDVEDRSDDEEEGAKPVEQPWAAVLEEDDNRGRETE